MQKHSSSEIESEVIKICDDINDIVKLSGKKGLAIWYDPNAGSNESFKFLEDLHVISDAKAFANWQVAAQHLQDNKIPFCQVITSGINSELFVREISQLQNVYFIHVFCDNIADHKKWISQYPKVVSVDSEPNELLIHFKVFAWLRILWIGGNEVENEEEIIIKCNLKDIVECFRKESFIIWYNPNADSNKSTKFLKELGVISDVKIFANWQDAVKCLKNNEIESCQVITSGTNSEKFVREISHMKNIFSIHVFCDNIEDHKKWSLQYSKIMSNVNDFHQLKANLEEKLIEFQKKLSSLRNDLPVYASIFDDIDKSKNKYLHFYLKGFVHFQNRTQAKKDLLELARALYGEDNKDIDEF